MDLNIALALVSYFFINKKYISTYTLKLQKLRQFIVISYMTFIFDIIWIAIWSKAYQKYDDTPSGTIKFAFVMVFIGVIIKV